MLMEKQMSQCLTTLGPPPPPASSLSAETSGTPRRLLLSHVPQSHADGDRRPGSTSARIAQGSNNIVAWLLDGAHDAPTLQALVEEVCGRLVRAGIPLERAGVFMWTLHPDIAGLRLLWHRGRPTELGQEGYEYLESEEFRGSPAVQLRPE